MQVFMLFIDSNTLHVSVITCPSSSAQETACAARCRIQLSLILSLNTITGSHSFMSSWLWGKWRPKHVEFYYQ